MEEHNTQLGLHGQGSTHIVSSQHSTDQENQSGDEEGQSPNNKRRRLSVDQEAAPKGPMKSRYLGVTWRKAQQGWAAQLTVNSKPVNLGTFDTEEEAARAYDQAAICHPKRRKRLKLNFPIETYPDFSELQATPWEDFLNQLRSSIRSRKHTSQYKGVRRSSTASSKWEAFIRVAGTFVSLGLYDEEKAAAQAHDQAAIVRHSHSVTAMGTAVKANLLTNFPLEEYRALLAGGDAADAASPEAVVSSGFTPLEARYVCQVLELCRDYNQKLNTLRETVVKDSDGELDGDGATCDPQQQLHIEVDGAVDRAHDISIMNAAVDLLLIQSVPIGFSGH